MKTLITLLTVLLAISANAAQTQLNLLSFGADPTGTRDSTRAMEQWLLAADNMPTQSGATRTFYAPRGQYIFTNTMTLPAYGVVFGDGPRLVASEGTYFDFRGPVSSNAFEAIASSQEFDHLQLRDFCVRGPSGSTGAGIYFYDKHEFEVKNVRCFRFANGFKIESCWDFVMNNAQGDGCSNAGLFLYSLVTDGTIINGQFSNNTGYGLLVDTPSPQNIQVIRLYGGSFQYNKLGNWWNGGIECVIDSTHLEGNFGNDWRFGSATNRVENFNLRQNHYDWSDAQYDLGVATWGPAAVSGYYQIILSNAWHFRLNDGHRNVAATPDKNRAAIYVSSLCADIAIDSTSSYLAPRVVSAIPLNRTNPNRNLLQNGLFLRDERNPNNYPYTWITDYPHTNYVFTSQTSSNILGYTYSGMMTNNSSFYVTNYFTLKTNTFYTYSQVIKGPAGSVALQRIVDRNQWNGGSNDVYQAINFITNTGSYQWIVSAYNCVDEYHTNPYLFTTLYSPGTNLLEIGEACLVEGYGVGRPVLPTDAYTTGNPNTPWPTYAEQIPNQGTWPAGKIVWADGSTNQNTAGWYCVTGGNPGTWLPFTIGITSLTQDPSGVVTATAGFSVVGQLLAQTFSVDTLNTGILGVTNTITASNIVTTTTGQIGTQLGVGVAPGTNSVDAVGAVMAHGVATGSNGNAISMGHDGTDGLIQTWNSTGFGVETVGQRRMTFDASGQMQLQQRVRSPGFATTNLVTAPTAASLGANGGMFWSSNTIPYFTYSADGVSATTKEISLVP